MSFDLTMLAYLEVNLVAIILLLAMLFYILKTHSNYSGSDQRFFIGLLVSNVLALLADSGIYLLRGNAAPAALLLTELCCLTYFMLHPIFAYLWLRYCLQRLYPDFSPSRRLQLAFLGPCLCCAMLMMGNHWTGWIYRLAAGNRYLRGPWIALITAFSMLYWAAGVLLTVRECLRPRCMREHALYLALLCFPLPVLAGILLQLLFYGLSVGWVCSALSLLILFIDWQSTQLSLDTLTGLYSRRQTNQQIAWEIRHLESASTLLFVVMIDIDHFKAINDQFGHLAGDEALVTVAKILRAGCREQDFIGRFGGDEFVVVGRAQNRAEVDCLMNRLHKTAEQYTKAEALPYVLALSTGYSLFSRDDLLSIDRVILEADREMYRVKEAKKVTL